MRKKNDEKIKFKEINRNCNFCSSSSSWKLIFLPGIRVKMCPGTASGECIMCSYSRTVVGIGTGIYRVTDPQFVRTWKSACVPGKYVRGITWWPVI